MKKNIKRYSFENLPHLILVCYLNCIYKGGNIPIKNSI